MTALSALVLSLAFSVSIPVPGSPLPDSRSPIPDPRSPITGVVVDGAGRPVPRAAIEVISADGTVAATVFSSADGTFTAPSAPDGCRLRATLAGFQPASIACRTDAPVKLSLSVAPVAEQIVVSATRTEAPSGQVAAALSVFDADTIERRQEPPLADLLRQAPGTTVVRVGAPGAVTAP